MAMATTAIRAQYQLDTIHYAGDSKHYIDIVYLGDGFQADEMQTFVDFVTTQADLFFNKDPWTRYRSLFNVFYVKTPSNVSGAGMTPSSPIDNFYGVCFGTSGVDRMPWPTKWDKVFEVLNAVKPDYDVVPIVVNSMKYGGGGGKPFICFSMDVNSIETLRHESGHAIGSLADEYWYQGREAANMTQNVNPVKWQRWIGEDGVGTYRYSENASEEAYSWYRPHQDCLMRYLYREYCPVCTEALVESIHDASQFVLAYSPDRKTANMESSDITFTLKLLKPEPNTLRVDWLIDGQNVAHNQEQLLLKAGSIENGTHQLTAIVEDTTLLVLTPGHSTLHSTTVTWHLEVSTPSAIKSTDVAENKYAVGPLPFSDELTFANKNPGRQLHTRMELLNTAGSIVASSTFSGDERCSLPTARLSPGIYILCVYQQGKLIYKRKVTKGER